jgi:hypothetical protein
MGLSIEEITEDFKIIRPSSIPILDISLVTMLGKYMNKYENFNKWEVSPHFLEEIISSIKMKYPNLTESIESNIERFTTETTEAKKKFEGPDSFKYEERILNIVIELYKDNMTNFDKFDQRCVMDLITFKYEIIKLIKDCTLIYEIKWNEIDVYLETIEDILMENFTELESDPSFQDTIIMIEKIGDAAEKDIKTLITYTGELLQSVKEMCNSKNTIDDIYMYEDVKKSIKEKFNKQIDKIYYQKVMLQKFSPEISKALLEMFEVEKSMHRIALVFTEMEKGIQSHSMTNVP